MKNISSKQFEVKKFITMLSFVVLATFVICYQDIVRSYNSTLLALSYKYGFTSRSLLGTIYHFLDEVLPINMIQYDMVLLFAQICTTLFFISIIVFCYFCIKNWRVAFRNTPSFYPLVTFPSPHTGMGSPV